MSEPTKGDWLALYQAAIAFQQVSPWEWMDNEGIFAVENPDDGEVGYCSIMGSGGEEFGLGMLVGEEGYTRYQELISGETEPEEIEDHIMERSIAMLLVDRALRSINPLPSQMMCRATYSISGNQSKKTLYSRAAIVVTDGLGSGERLRHRFGEEKQVPKVSMQ